MSIREFLDTAIKENRTDKIYDKFMFSSMRQKQEVLIYFIRTLQENPEGVAFVNILVNLIHDATKLDELVFSYNALQESVLSDKLDFFNLLLMNGASLNVRSKEGESCYDIILTQGSERFLDFIISYENVIEDCIRRTKTK